MQALDKRDLAGAANLNELANWLGMSRNLVEGLMSDLGIESVSGKYPWMRLVTGVLGTLPQEAATGALAMPTMTLAEAAEELGLAAETLKRQIERGEIAMPPLYVFGPRRRRFIRVQVHAFVRSPSGNYPKFPLLPEAFCDLSEVAGEAGMTPDDLRARFDQGTLSEPIHVILEGGERRYFRAHAVKLFRQDSLAPHQEPRAPVSTGGILAIAARSVARYSGA